METKLYTENDIDEIVEMIKSGCLVAFATDTVYGLAADIKNKESVEKMKKVKGRTDSKPFPIMVSNVDQIKEIAIVNDREKKLIEAFMPGALTIVFKKKSNLDEYVTNGFGTVAVRMPDDKFVLALIERIGHPLLVTSANISDEPSCLNFKEVIEQLGGLIEGVVVGASGGNVASTIVDCSGKKIEILRKGEITLDNIKEVIWRTN